MVVVFFTKYSLNEFSLIYIELLGWIDIADQY